MVDWPDRWHPLPDMHTPPERPGCPYLCQRNASDDEKRFPFIVDYWQPEGRWGAPRLGYGLYAGCYDIPPLGWWPGDLAPDSPLVLTHLRHRYSGIWYLPRGFYLGRVEPSERKNEWWIDFGAIDSWGGKGWLRVPESLISWVPLPTIA